VVPTRDRAVLLRRAVESITTQDYPGHITVVAVYDESDLDPSLESVSDGRTVIVLRNTRTPGLAGGRNTGLLALETDLVAACDDDDVWLPGKLSRQVNALLGDPHAEFSSTAIVVDYGGTESVRLAGRDRFAYADLLPKRWPMLHSSTFLAWRKAQLDGIGLYDESIPHSMSEDWDILLRAARRHEIVHVDEPLVRVEWGSSSYYLQKWERKLAGHNWMLEHHPDIKTCPRGVSRVYGQMAFAHAALGHVREAHRYIGRSLINNWREPRAFLAWMVAAHLTRPQTVLHQLHKRGHGL
jgi:glycosyltransferase involved in cell wall biosynthesis